MLRSKKDIKFVQQRPLRPAAFGVQQRLSMAVYDTFQEYINTSKLNGLWLLNKKYTSGPIKCIWGTILVLLYSFSVYLMLLLWLNFYSHPIITDIADALQITEVPFPGVTICNDRMSQPELEDEFIEKLKIPDEFTKAQVKEGIQLINYYSLYDVDSEMFINYTALENTLKYNNISIFQAARRIKPGCDDLSLRCFWLEKEFSCQNDDLVAFKNVPTPFGSCCSLNFIRNNHQFLQIYHNYFGISTGLKVLGRFASAEKNFNSIFLFLHHPQDSISSISTPISLKHNHVTYIKVKPVCHTTSPDVLELPPSKRFCLTSDDVEFNYRYEHCFIICVQKKMLEACGCCPYLFMYVDNIKNKPECTLKDVKCYIKNRGL